LIDSLHHNGAAEVFTCCCGEAGCARIFFPSRGAASDTPGEGAVS
jgi:hypothetical protein